MALLYAPESIPQTRESPSDLLDNPLRVVSTWIAMLVCSCTYLITHGPDEYIFFWEFAVIYPYTCNVMGWPRGDKLWVDIYLAGSWFLCYCAHLRKHGLRVEAVLMLAMVVPFQGPVLKM